MSLAEDCPSPSSPRQRSTSWPTATIRTSSTIDYTPKTLTSNTRELKKFPAPPMCKLTHLLVSMHSCLSVDEILRLIACKLAASTGQAATIALARCCKSFEDPALDALWETQDRLIPLLKSLPGDVWDGDTCTVSTTSTRIFLFLN
jgi:hypothetical protein